MMSIKTNLVFFALLFCQHATRLDFVKFAATLRARAPPPPIAVRHVIGGVVLVLVLQTIW